MLPLTLTGIPDATAETEVSSAAAALATGLGITPAQARDRLAAQEAAAGVSSALRTDPTDGFAGQWFDRASGRLAVAVTTSAAADRARAAGAVPHSVARDQAELDRLTAAVAGLAGGGVPGISGWGVDPVANEVVVRHVRGASTAGTRSFLDALAELGPGVQVRDTASAPAPQAGEVRPGDPWWPGGESNCSVGFAATDSNGGKHFVTAGHCTDNADQPAYGDSGGQDRIGTSNVGGTHSVNAREGDMGAVAVTGTDWELSAEVNTWGEEPVTVAGSAEPMVGQAVCHSGNTSKWQCGEVTAVDQTVDYGGVIVEGLATTTACSMGGDSGGAWLAGDLAVGLHSGGQASCSPGGAEDQSILQPVEEAVQKWSLTLYTGDDGLSAAGR
ncbi:secreted serine protease [Amycolatopsis antarctica]|uniref:Secreted serine protease n=2 Tax=Amycolatopsis antarctica TaxID=1854586 RepID=A0A263CZV7_9PSEU|nr:secreted serine protease [Amycolatopsis antarctica]